MIQRLKTLYENGGIGEVKRGIHDYILTNTPLWKLYRKKTLSVGDVSVTILCDSQESFWRATGHGEKQVMREFVNSIDMSDTVWDVGANLGSWSLLAAKKTPAVFAFEPGGISRGRLERNAEYNGIRNRIDSIPIALSNENRTASLFLSDSTATRDIVKSPTKGDTVQLRTGNSLDIHPEPTVVKIDVEGGEIDVLEGMRNRLDTVHTLFVEVHEGVSKQEVIQIGREHGLTDVTEHTVRGSETILVIRREQ